jgi:catechol 2,3-dioxygenase-like lactoylglutathione lyase family enzyme
MIDFPSLASGAARRFVRALTFVCLAPLLEVFDMPTSIEFYRDALGFAVIATCNPGPNFGWALLSLNGVELMLNTAYDAAERPPVPDPARKAAHRDTAMYFACPNVDAAYAYLRAAGLAARGPQTAPYGMRQLYLSDPDGYTLCFQWPASEQMRSEWKKRYGAEAAVAG